MPEESEKGCLWSHFPLYLTHNWTTLISCQNKYVGYISVVIKNVVWKSKDAWMSTIPHEGSHMFGKYAWEFVRVSVQDQNQHARV